MTKRAMVVITILILAMIGALILFITFAFSQSAHAEALPSPDAASMLRLEGDLRISEAPVELYIADCLRVDVARIGQDGAWGDLTLPYVPPSIVGVMLYDGWHLINGQFERTGEATLRILFRAEDLAALDGTVGLYLVILADAEGAGGEIGGAYHD